MKRKTLTQLNKEHRMNKYDSEFLYYLREEVEMTDRELSSSSNNEIFDKVLEYEGHGTFAGTSIRRWVKLIYGIDLKQLDNE